MSVFETAITDFDADRLVVTSVIIPRDMLEI